MNFLEDMVTGKDLIGVRKRRNQAYIFQKFDPELQEKMEMQGWEIDKILKTQIRMKKIKPLDEQFEDEVWGLFAALGFQYMNRDRNLEIDYGAVGTNTTKQVDVLAIDEETIIFVECKCALSGRKGDFKKEIEAINGIKAGLYRTVRKKFPNRKVGYIFATKNYDVIKADQKRMKELGVQFFDEYTIKYYYELAKHLGRCARFQLLGRLFEGNKISGMDTKIPAIQGKMGTYTYYSFSIEPEKLLKIAYVLHRNEANNELMPTYQRIIKKNRLKEIQNFIDSGGFFPNSIIISIDTRGKKLVFDLAKPQVESSISKIGILHLPQLYRSAYVIDGQHRLYGYADSCHAIDNSIPVVAFENLDKTKQVELFMEINENQKAVPKNLQNILNADLLWTSDDWNKQRKALRLNIAQLLGETPSSPFFGHIILGEGEQSKGCRITIETIGGALKATDFFTRYGNGNDIIENGTFDKGNNEATRDLLYPYLVGCFNYIKEELPEEWERDETEFGILTVNNTIHALIRILNDIINYLIKFENINPKNMEMEQLIEHTLYFLAPLIYFFNSITEDQRKEIRTNYGSGGKPKVWRIFQKVIHDARSEFNPEGLDEWIRDNTKQYNVESFKMTQELEYIIKKEFENKLKSKYGVQWLTAGLPPKVYKQANGIMGKQNYTNAQNGLNKEVSLWECVTIKNCRDIAIFGSNWSELFETIYTRPEDTKILGGKQTKTNWMVKLSDIAEKNNNINYSVSEEEYLFLLSLYKWLKR